jgi:hypothetical protein
MVNVSILKQLRGQYKIGWGKALKMALKYNYGPCTVCGVIENRQFANDICWSCYVDLWDGMPASEIKRLRGCA